MSYQEVLTIPHAYNIISKHYENYSQSSDEMACPKLRSDQVSSNVIAKGGDRRNRSNGLMIKKIAAKTNNTLPEIFPPKVLSNRPRRSPTISNSSSNKLTLIEANKKFYLKDSDNNLNFINRKNIRTYTQNSASPIFETFIYAELANYDILYPYTNPKLFQQIRTSFDLNLFNALCMESKLKHDSVIASSPRSVSVAETIGGGEPQCAWHDEVQPVKG